MNDDTRQAPALPWIAGLILATVAFRLLLAWGTPVPSEDGVGYLWMAQRFAAGAWQDALAEVFPPGFPLLCAPWIALGLDPWTVGILVGVGAAGLTVLPLVRIAGTLQPGAWLGAGVLWASGSLLARNAVEVYSEPPFLLAMACGCLAGLQGRWWWLGLWSGIAFWIRPEGSLLPIAFVLVHRRPALVALLPTIAAVAALGATHWAAGHGFDPLPIHGFHEQRDDLPDRGHFVANLLQVPGAWFEAFGVAGLLPLLVVRRRGYGPLVWQIVLQIAVVCTFVVRRRFFLSAAVPVVAMAAVALAAMPRAWRRWTVLALVIVGVVTAWNGRIEPDRLAERRVGEFLGPQLRAEDELTGDLTRVLWFAGRRPLPPRHFTAADLLARTAAPNVRFVVLAERRQREQFAELAAGLAPHFARLVLPAELDELCRRRGIAVFARR